MQTVKDLFTAIRDKNAKLTIEFDISTMQFEIEVLSGGEQLFKGGLKASALEISDIDLAASLMDIAIK